MRPRPSTSWGPRSSWCPVSPGVQAQAGVGEAAAGLYDRVLLDCPPSLDLLTLNALTAADEVLIPIQCEYYALEGLTQLMQSIRMVREELNPGLTVEVLLTMFDPRTNLAHQVAEEVRSFFGDRVFQTIVPRNVRLSEAPSFDCRSRSTLPRAPARRRTRPSPRRC